MIPLSVIRSKGGIKHKEEILTIRYSDDVLLSLKESKEEFEREARYLLALKLYELGKMSSGKAAKIAGISRVAFLMRMGMYVEELVMLVIKHWGNGDYITDNTLNQPHEARLLKLDASKARALLGWKPIYNVYEAVERTIGWYKNFYNGVSKEKLYDLTVGLIKEYENYGL